MNIPRELQLVLKPRPPRAVHKFVLRLVDKIGTGAAPVWVNVKTAKNAIVDECFINVRNHIEKSGGTIQYGWTIWQSANVLIEGEFHAVWVSPQGQYLDVSPKPDGETRILFLPDNSRKWNEQLMDNVRLPLINAPEIDQYLKAAAEQAAYRQANWKPDSPMTLEQNERMEEFGMNELRLVADIASKYVPAPNKPCPCESGRQFGNCCGKL
jgi:hypothetical protein